MQELTNPTLAPYAKNGECLVRVTAKAGTAAEAEEMMAPVVEKVLDMFGDLAYAVDGANIAEHTVKLLIEKGVSLAAAESCTGGELEARITDIPGASAVLRGGVLTAEGKCDMTRYACCMDAEAGVYYVKTYENSRVRAYGMRTEGDVIQQFSMQGEEDILFVD